MAPGRTLPTRTLLMHAQEPQNQSTIGARKSRFPSCRQILKVKLLHPFSTVFPAWEGKFSCLPCLRLMGGPPGIVLRPRTPNREADVPTALLMYCRWACTFLQLWTTVFSAGSYFRPSFEHPLPVLQHGRCLSPRKSRKLTRRDLHPHTYPSSSIQKPGEWIPRG